MTKTLADYNFFEEVSIFGDLADIGPLGEDD